MLLPMLQDFGRLLTTKKFIKKFRTKGIKFANTTSSILIILITLKAVAQTNILDNKKKTIEVAHAPQKVQICEYNKVMITALATAQAL